MKTVSGNFGHKEVRGDESELVTVTFQDGPLGVKLRRRADDGIAFVFEVVEDSQAVDLDVVPGDELWSIGEYDLGETFLDKEAWGSLIEYIKFCPRPLTVILRRKPWTSQAINEYNGPAIMSTPLEDDQSQTSQPQRQDYRPNNDLEPSVASRKGGNSSNSGRNKREAGTIDRHDEQAVINKERCRSVEGDDEDEDEDVEIPLHTINSSVDGDGDGDGLTDKTAALFNDRTNRRTVSSTISSRPTTDNSPPTVMSEHDADLVELSSQLVFREKEKLPFVGAFANFGASSSGAGSTNLVKEGRRLLKTGELQVKSKAALWNTQNRKAFFLLSDILIVATRQGQQYLVDHVIDLQACKVRTDGQDQTPSQSSGAMGAGAGQQFGVAAIAFVGAMGEQIRQQAAGLSPMQSPHNQAPQFPFTITWPGGLIETQARTQDEKDDWVNAIYAAACDSVGADERTLGWRHQYKSGTMHSAVIARDEGKVRALIGACESGQLEYEAIESADDEGYTPLHYACILRFPAAVRMLLEAGVSGMVPDRHGFTPLHWAALQLDSQSMAHLCAFATDVDVPDHEYRTPLYLACVEGRDVAGRTDCLQLRGCIAALAEQNADVNVRDANGVSLLHYLAASWQPEPLEELLLAGANVHTTDEVNRQTALHFAAAAMPIKLAVGEGARVLSGSSAVAGLADAAVGVQPSYGRSRRNLDDDAPEAINPLDATNTLRVLFEYGVRGNVRDASGLTTLQVLCNSSDRWGRIYWDAVGTMLSYGVRLDDSPQCVGLKSNPSIPLGEPIEQWMTAPPADADRANLQMNSLMMKEDASMAADPSSAKEKEKSKTCSLCGFQYTLFRRQHHCRMCASSCCDDCSKKKVLLQGQPSRCCDACYNVVTYKVRREEIEEEKRRAAATVAARATMSSAAATSGGGGSGRWGMANRAQSQGQGSFLRSGNGNGVDADASNRRDLFGSLGSSISGSIGGILNGSSNAATASSPWDREGATQGQVRDYDKNTARGARSGVGATMSVMNELQERMAERGEKLSRMADRSADMSNAASEFSKLARQLNQQQQNRWF